MTEPTNQPFMPNLPISLDGATYEPITDERRQTVLVEIEKIVPTQIAASAERWENLYVIDGVTYSVSGLNREGAEVVYRVQYPL